MVRSIERGSASRAVRGPRGWRRRASLSVSASRHGTSRFTRPRDLHERARARSRVSLHLCDCHYGDSRLSCVHPVLRTCGARSSSNSRRDTRRIERTFRFRALSYTPSPSPKVWSETNNGDETTTKSLLITSLTRMDKSFEPAAAVLLFNTCSTQRARARAQPPDPLKPSFET